MVGSSVSNQRVTVDRTDGRKRVRNMYRSMNVCVASVALSADRVVKTKSNEHVTNSFQASYRNHSPRWVHNQTPTGM